MRAIIAKLHVMRSGNSVEIKKSLRRIFYGRTIGTTYVNDILLIANLAVVMMSITSLFLETGRAFQYVEFGFGAFFAIEYALRFWVSRHKVQFFFRLVNVLDILVIGSLLTTVFVPNLAVLRILRTLQILRAYKFYGKRFDHHNEFIYRNLEIITASVNIIVFLFVMSTLVFIQQRPINDSVSSYLDALYYTIATVTTTGFGDITVVGTGGKLLSIIIMILGVTLFFRLIKSIFVPHQLYTICSHCGHDHHSLDAHYCSQCGHKIKNRYFIDHINKHKDDF
jgi:voltage-gated potassium channel